MPYYKHRNSHCGDQTMQQSPYLHNGCPILVIRHHILHTPSPWFRQCCVVSVGVRAIQERSVQWKSSFRWMLSFMISFVELYILYAATRLPYWKETIIMQIIYFSGSSGDGGILRMLRIVSMGRRSRSSPTSKCPTTSSGGHVLDVYKTYQPQSNL